MILGKNVYAKKIGVIGFIGLGGWVVDNEWIEGTFKDKRINYCLLEEAFFQVGTEYWCQNL